MRKFVLLLMVLIFCSCGKMAKYSVVLKLDITPEVCEVYVNGDFIGKSPFKEEGIKVPIYKDKAEPIEISVKKEFFQTQTISYSPDINNRNQEFAREITLAAGLEEYKGLFRDKTYKLKFSQVLPMDKKELLLLDAEIKAQYGMAFEEKEYQDYFNKQDWYKINPDYNRDLLSYVDLVNLSVIDTMLIDEDAAKKNYISVLSPILEGEGENFLVISPKYVLDTKKTGMDPYKASMCYMNMEYLFQLAFAYGSLLFIKEDKEDYYTVLKLQYNHNKGKIDMIERNVFLSKVFQKKILNNKAELWNLSSNKNYINNLESDRNAYHPVKFLDGKPETAWMIYDGSKYSDSTLKITFKNGVIIDEVRIMGGFFDDRYFETKNRLQWTSLTFSSSYPAFWNRKDKKFYADLDFKDVMEEQSKKFSPILCEEFELEIHSTFKAIESKNWDLAISEISFYYLGEKIEIDLGEDYSEYLDVNPEQEVESDSD